MNHATSYIPHRYQVNSENIEDNENIQHSQNRVLPKYNREKIEHFLDVLSTPPDVSSAKPVRSPREQNIISRIDSMEEETKISAGKEEDVSFFRMSDCGLSSTTDLSALYFDTDQFLTGLSSLIVDKKKHDDDMSSFGPSSAADLSGINPRVIEIKSNEDNRFGNPQKGLSLTADFTDINVDLLRGNGAPSIEDKKDEGGSSFAILHNNGSSLETNSSKINSPSEEVLLAATEDDDDSSCVTDIGYSLEADSMLDSNSVQYAREIPWTKYNSMDDYDENDSCSGSIGYSVIGYSGIDSNVGYFAPRYIMVPNINITRPRRTSITGSKPPYLSKRRAMSGESMFYTNDGPNIAGMMVAIDKVQKNASSCHDQNQEDISILKNDDSTASSSGVSLPSMSTSSHYTGYSKDVLHLKARMRKIENMLQSMDRKSLPS